MAQVGDTISVQCSCGKKLKAPSTAVGKKAKCPACGNVLTIEAPPPPPAEDDPLGAIYDLAAAEQAAASSNQVDDSPRCPKCGASMGSGAVLCVNCGYDFRSKQKMSTSKAAPAAAAASGKGKPLAYAAEEERPPAEGNYFMGIVFGFLFALGGAAVYAVASYFLDDVPFLSLVARWGVLGVGYLAGVGVDKGYKGGNLFAGMTAAGITLVVALITKFVVLAALIAPGVKKAMAAHSTDRDDERVSQMVRDDAMKKDGISPHGASDEIIEKYENDAGKRVTAMSDSEYESYEKRADSYEEREALFEYVQRDVLKEKGIDPVKVTRPQEILAAKEAETRLAGMTDAQVHEKLKTADAQAAEEFKAKMEEVAKKHNSDSGDKSDKSSGISSGIVGFGIALGLVVLLWLMLPTIVAMCWAYKVAANA
jgi:hypothetical protein